MRAPAAQTRALRALQHAGAQRLADEGFVLDDEEWRFANTRGILEREWALASPIPEQQAQRLFAQHTLVGEAATGRGSTSADEPIELVFINGAFAPGLSTLGVLPPGVYIGPFSLASQSQELITAPQPLTQTAFQSLNAAFLTDAALVTLTRGVRLERPIHVLSLLAPAGAGMIHPRLAVSLEAGAAAQLVETYAADAGTDIFCNSVTTIALGEGAILDHVSHKPQAEQLWHVSSTLASLERSAQLVSHAVTLDSRWTRNDLEVALAGEGAHATLNGAVLLAGNRFCDNHTLIRHEVPNCTSHELYKHVVADSAFGVFKGKILVKPGAQKTDAKQTNKTLLVSDTAMMESMPALEIYADDVKCTHGSTTGPLDDDMIFYLRSRGLSVEAARHLLTYAFAADVTRRIRIEPVRRRVEDWLAAQQDLPMDLRISDAASHDELVVG
jgi:Fe-S cluster assembly protein SufD